LAAFALTVGEILCRVRCDQFPNSRTIRRQRDASLIRSAVAMSNIRIRTLPHVAAELDKAAAGADPDDVSVALQMVLMSENVECWPK
jgi:hypothetical protein